MESVKIDFVNHIITVTLDDGTSTTYTDSASYLADHPDREADCLAMGWTI